MEVVEFPADEPEADEAPEPTGFTLTGRDLMMLAAGFAIASVIGGLVYTLVLRPMP
jgi:hypothetical protein